MRTELELVAAAERGQDAKKRPAKARRPVEGLREGPPRCVDARKGGKSGSRPGGPGNRPSGCVGRIEERPCGFCGQSFRPAKPWQRFCGQGCRRLYSAAEEIVREYSVGRASGIRPLVERLKTCKQ